MLRFQGGWIALCLALGPAGVFADPIQSAFKAGDLELDLRYRYELVGSEGFVKNAHAHTLRLRLGWTTGTWKGLYARAAFDGNFALGPENYNSTANGHTDRPTVADPDDQQLNQAFLAYKRADYNLHAIAGRQRLSILNERYVGTVAFRQLEQVFDSARLSVDPIDDLQVDYQYSTRAYRVFGNHNPDPDKAHQDIQAHFVTVQYGGLPVDIAGYFYGTKYEDNPTGSNQNLGLRVTGKPRIADDLRLPFQAEYTRQSDFSNAPDPYTVDYVLAELGLQTRWATAAVGYEMLGSDAGRVAWQAPFSTLHKFNGWADLFLTTPNTGLQDLYVLARGAVRRVKWVARFHSFSADEGGTDYGKELDLQVLRRFDIYTVEVKFAHYWTDQAPPPNQMTPVLPLQLDTTKLWVTLHMAL